MWIVHLATWLAGAIVGDIVGRVSDKIGGNMPFCGRCPIIADILIIQRQEGCIHHHHSNHEIYVCSGMGDPPTHCRRFFIATKSITTAQYYNVTHNLFCWWRVRGKQIGSIKKEKVKDQVKIDWISRRNGGYCFCKQTI